LGQFSRMRLKKKSDRGRLVRIQAACKCY